MRFLSVFAMSTFTSRSEARISANARPVASLISMIGRSEGFCVSCLLVAFSARANRSSPLALRMRAGRPPPAPASMQTCLAAPRRILAIVRDRSLGPFQSLGSSRSARPSPRK